MHYDFVFLSEEDDDKYLQNIQNQLVIFFQEICNCRYLTNWTEIW
jgi:hypothetical protein